MSMDFLDDHHVLLTFNPKKMFMRLPDCPPSHDDRLIHAVIFDVSSGRVVREADWYMHDHQRYLWSLGSGRLMLRRENSLYQLDSALNEKLLLKSPTPFLWISVTPDGKQIIVERKQDETADSKAKEQGKPGKPQAKPKVQIEFLDSESLAVQRVIKSEGVVNLEALSTGFADVIHGLSGKVWLVRFGPSGTQRQNIMRVRSHCVPDILYSSSNTLMVGRCAMNSPDYSVSAFTVTGHFLWRQHWSEHRYTPKIQRSDDGSRVAVSSIARVIVPAPAAASSEGAELEAADDPDAGLQQHVQILDTATGKEVLALTVNPAAIMARNISLSPDGRTLVVMQGTNLEVHALPEMAQEDHAKYMAAKADVPGLDAPVSQLPSGESPEETTFASVDAAEESAREAQTSTATAGAAAPPPDASGPASSATRHLSPQAPAVSDADAPPITLRSSTHIVVEDVVVTDSKGHSVKGLSQQDFHVTEDGKPQSVRSFEEFPQAGAVPAASPSLNAVPSQPAQPASKLPPNIYTNNKPSGPETGSATMVVLDLLNTPIPDQQRAREQLIAFIKKNPAASEMALCTLASNLRLIQGFTHDENALISAVNGKKGGVKAPPWQSDSGMERSVQFTRDAVAVGAGTVEQLQRTQLTLDAQNAADLDVRMRFTLDAFTQLARYLSGIPGRKNLVWLSGSFPLNIFPNPEVTDFQPVTRNYEFQVKKATNLLADAHVAVYPVGLSGVQTQSMFDVGNTGPYNQRLLPGSEGPPAAAPGASATNLANTSANLPISSQMERDTRTFRETVSSQQATMEQVAVDTGGRAFLNSNGLEDAIKTAVDEGSHYYTFSYAPTNRKYDGAFRKIKVNLEAKGYRLAYRRGYYAVDPDAGAKDTRAPQQRVGVAAMQQGSPESRQIVFSTRVVPVGKPHKVDAATAGMASAKKKETPAGPIAMQHYGIDYAVDPSDLRFGITSSNTYHAVLSFMVTGFNDDGRLVASLVSTATSDLKPANYKDVLTGGFRLHQELDVPTEAVILRLGVEDAISSHVGTMEIPLPVPTPPDAPQIATHTLPPIEPD